MGTVAKERPYAVIQLASQPGYAASLRLERRGGRVAHHFPLCERDVVAPDLTPPMKIHCTLTISKCLQNSSRSLGK